jgi:uncharacterized protein (TIGR03435 family)
MRSKKILAPIFLMACLFGQAPATGPSFEVASIKPAPDPGGQARTEISNPSHIRRYTTIGNLIKEAYHMGTNQKLTGPDWVQGPDAQYFEIEANLPDGAKPEQIPSMLQRLLVERFRLRIRTEDKEERAYFLRVGLAGPKLKEVSPGQPSQPWKGKSQGQVLLVRSGTASGGWRMYSRLGADVILDAYKISMPELASALQIEVGRPVVDRTGLTGVYEISMAVPGGRFDQAAHSDLTGNSPALDSAEVGGGSVAHSLGQLGLRLEAGKISIENLVVEHIERVPTEN